MSDITPTVCDAISAISEYGRHELATWAVHEPSERRAVAGVVLGAVGLAAVEALLRAAVGCAQRAAIVAQPPRPRLVAYPIGFPAG